MAPVWVRKHKRPEGSMLWGAYEIVTDEHGIWLYTPEGSTVRGRRGGVVGESFVGVPEPPGLHVLHLVPVNGWWFGTWAEDGVGRRIAIDVCTPPARRAGAWTFDDLELDVVRLGDQLDVFDDRELDDAVEQGFISPHEARMADAAAAVLHRRLGGADALFDVIGWERLHAAIDAALPAIAAPEDR